MGLIDGIWEILCLPLPPAHSPLIRDLQRRVGAMRNDPFSHDDGCVDRCACHTEQNWGLCPVPIHGRRDQKVEGHVRDHGNFPVLGPPFDCKLQKDAFHPDGIFLVWVAAT